MEKRKLGELVRFTPGINQSRFKDEMEKQKIDFYDQSSFAADYEQGGENVEHKSANLYTDNRLLNSGDIVISHSLQLATMVGQRNVGKVLSLNFTKVGFEESRLDKGYFLYLFNVYKEIQKQKEKETQGGSLTMRITQQSLAKMTIPFVSLEEQKKIGAIYIENLRLQNKLNIYGKLLEQVMKNVLEENLKE